MARAIINRLFDQIRNIRIEDFPDGKISLSTGAVINTEEKEISFADLYTSADKAMYRSKELPGNSLTFGSL